MGKPSAAALEERSSPPLRLGDEVRQLRQAKGLTLRVLAERTGRSIGYLSQLERDLVTPSLATLQELSLALGVEMSWFLPPAGSEDERERSVVVRSHKRRRLSYTYSRKTESLGYEDFLLSGNLDARTIMGLSRIQPGGSTAREPEQHDIDLCGYVVQGTLTLLVESETFKLQPGDSFSFNAQRSHLLRNEAAEVVEVVWAIAPVSLSAY